MMTLLGEEMVFGLKEHGTLSLLDLMSGRQGTRTYLERNARESRG